MAAPAKTGEYTITFYNGYGTKMRDLTAVSLSETVAQQLGEDTVKERKIDGDNDTAHSFTIDRRIFNSLDNRSRF